MTIASEGSRDRREALRISPERICVVLAHVGEERICGDLLDVSFKGFSAHFGRSLGEGECCAFSLVFELNRTATVVGFVVYERPDPAGGVRCGINFRFSDIKEERLIREWIMEQQRTFQRKRVRSRETREKEASSTP